MMFFLPLAGVVKDPFRHPLPWRPLRRRPPTGRPAVEESIDLQRRLGQSHLPDAMAGHSRRHEVLLARLSYAMLGQVS